eukprot:Clim_evm51s150 gene=Clim_evmTU51s150
MISSTKAKAKGKASATKAVTKKTSVSKTANGKSLAKKASSTKADANIKKVDVKSSSNKTDAMQRKKDAKAAAKAKKKEEKRKMYDMDPLDGELSQEASLLDKKQVAKAIAALQKHAGSGTGKEALLDSDAFINLTFAVKKIPQESKGLLPVDIPNTLYTPDDSNILFVSKDPQRIYKDLMTSQEIQGIDRVIGVSKLKAKFQPYEAKRQLAAMYDLVLCDDRVLPTLPRILGRDVYTKKKGPVPIQMAKGDPKRNIEKAMTRTYLSIGKGATSAVRIARLNFSKADAVENVMEGFESVLKHVPKGMKNIRSVHLKTDTSVAVPLYEY